MTLRREFSLVRRWLWLCGLCTFVAAAVAFLVLSRMTPSYTSTVTVIVGPALTGVAINMNDIEVGKALAPTYAALATTRPVVQRVIRATGTGMTVDELTGAITTRVPPDSSRLQITVSASSAYESATLANEVAQQLAGYPPESGSASPKAAAALVTVIDPAVPPTAPSSPRVLTSTAIAAAIGLFLAICVAFFMENFRPGGADAPVGETEGPLSWIDLRGKAKPQAPVAEPTQAKPANATPPGRNREVAADSGSSTPTMLATAIYVTGTASLEPGRRYGIAIDGPRLRILGPLDLDSSVVALDRAVVGADASAVNGRLLISERGGKSGALLAFMSVAGMLPDALAGAITDAAGASIES